MSPEDIKNAFAERLNAVSELRALVDDTNGEFNGEQEAQYQRLNEAINGLDKQINTGLEGLEQDKRSQDAAARFEQFADLTAEAPEAVATPAETDGDILRSVVRGERRNHTFYGTGEPGQCIPARQAPVEPSYLPIYTTASLLDSTKKALLHNSAPSSTPLVVTHCSYRRSQPTRLLH